MDSQPGHGPTETPDAWRSATDEQGDPERPSEHESDRRAEEPDLDDVGELVRSDTEAPSSDPDVQSSIDRLIAELKGEIPVSRHEEGHRTLDDDDDAMTGGDPDVVAHADSARAATDDGDDELPMGTPRPRRQRSRTRRALPFVAVFVVLLLVGFILSRSTSKPTNKSAPTRNALPGAGVNDGFTRADNNSTLGQADSGQLWKAVTGTWGIRDDEAYVVTPHANNRSLAVIDMGAGDGTVKVSFPHTSSGSGLVFRYKNSVNFWQIEAVTDYATWNVRKVVDGQSTSFGNVGTVATGAGTTISVRMQGPTIDIFVNGVKKLTLTDTSLQTEHFVGMSSRPSPDSDAARWDNFAATPQREPSTTTPSQASSTSSSSSSSAPSESSGSRSSSSSK
jgi:hypothetical protein